jgi:membrane fusion protein, multidrug efflux system
MVSRQAIVSGVVTVVVVAALGAWWMGARGGPEWAQAADAPASAPRGAASGQAPATLVTVAVAQKQDVPIDVTVNGSVVSLNSVDVRPQVSNMVQKVHVKEGEFVRAGQPLFTLDSRADLANLQKAKAQQLKDQASLADLERQYRRSQELLAQNFIAKSATESSLSQVEAQRAAVEADRAAVQTATVQLSYDEIRAPIPGRTGVLNAFVGTLAQPGSTLVTVTQLDPIAVQFPVPEGRLQDLLDAARQKSKVLALVPGRAKPLQGVLSFVDNTVDPQAGTVRAKATFDNADHALWPGQYVNARVTVRTMKDAVVVPIASVITGPTGRIVYVVKEQVVQPRKVEIAYSFGDQAVLSGVAAGERVVVEGKQNLRPGSRIRLERPQTASDGSGVLPARRDPT